MSMPSKQNLRTGTEAEGTGRMSVTSSVVLSTSGGRVQPQRTTSTTEDHQYHNETNNTRKGTTASH